MFANSPVWFRRSLWALMILAVAIRFVYWGYTHRTWEDALITVLHSEDAALGLGLTHPVPAGEGPLHGFTSPLSVLIPLVGDLMHVGFGVSFLKIVSALVAPIAVLLGALISLEIGLPYTLALVVAAFLGLEHHQILWGMAGMETEVVTTIYLFSLYALLRGRQWTKGISLGLLMLARPDAALWVGPFLLIEGWRAYRADRWRDLGPVVGGLALLYGPWLLFTTLYYGSPIPNTVRAKGLGYQSLFKGLQTVSPSYIPHVFKERFFSVFASLAPSYAGTGTGFVDFRYGSAIAALLMSFFVIGLVIAVRRKAKARYVYLLSCILGLYLWFIAPIIFGWYTAPVVAVTIIGCCYGFWVVGEMVRLRGDKQRIAGWLGVAYLLVVVAVLPVNFRSDKYVQQDVEDMRKQIGVYLASVSKPTDTIGSESLGYVGYYSRRVVYDYPGLCSRRVVQYLRDYPNERNIPRMMYHLEPTFIVMRPRELNSPAGQSIRDWLAQNYDLVRDYKTPPEANEKIYRFATSIDYEFRVFRRKPGVAPQS